MTQRVFHKIPEGITIEIIMAHHEQGMTTREIADKFGTTETALRAFRAKTGSVLKGKTLDAVKRSVAIKQAKLIGFDPRGKYRAGCRKGYLMTDKEINALYKSLGFRYSDDDVKTGIYRIADNLPRSPYQLNSSPTVCATALCSM